MAAIPSFVLDSNVQHHELKLAESYAPAYGGKLPDDPFWRYVEGRYDLAVNSGYLSRFEHYHPVITPLLQGNLEAPTTVPPHSLPEMPVLSPMPIMPPLPIQPVSSSPVTATGGPTMPVAPPVTAMAPSVPSAVPEPSSVILLISGLIAAVLIGWLRRPA